MASISRPQIGLRETLEVLFRHKGKIAAIFLITMVVAIAGSILQGKVYQAGARILVQHSRPQATVGAALTTPDATALITERDQIRTEIQIFLSQAVTEGAVQKLGAQNVLDHMTWRWDWLSELPRNAYAAVKRALGVEPAAITAPERLAVRRIGEYLEVEPVRETDVFSVSFRAPDPQFAALMVNTLIELYLERHLVVRQGAAATNVFGEQAQRLSEDLRAAEAAAQDFKQKWGIVATAPQKQLLLEQLSASEAALKQGDLDAAESDRRIAEIKRQISRQAMTIQQSTTSIRNPLIDALDRQLTQLEQDRAQYVAGSPVARQLDQEIAELKARMDAEKSKTSNTQVSGVNQTYQELQKALALEEGRRRGLDARAALRTQAEEYRKAVAGLDHADVELRELLRQVEVKEDALRLYRKKEEEARVSGMLDRKRITNVTPLESAEVPLQPVSPRKLVNLIAGLLVGLIGGIAVALLSEILRRSFATREEAERGLNLTVVAALMDDRAARSRAQNVLEVRRMSEALVQAHRRDAVRSVLVVSSSPREGKTYCVNALAMGLVHAGLRVLTVGTRPPPASAHEIVGSFDAAAPRLIKGEHPGLMRLTSLPGAARDAGGVPDRVAALLAKMGDQFDLVLLDGPALGTEPEGLWLAPAVDGVIAVVEAERTPALTASSTLRLVREAGGKLLGVVLNKRRFVIPQSVYGWLLTPQPR